jgi:glutamine amidotransferase-like uncharacterized protein
MKILFTSLLLFSTQIFAFDALVWGGPGACPEDCTASVVHAAKLAGLDPMVVTPENFDTSLFEQAKVWIQPGGKSGSASNAMGARIRSAIKEFVRQGGGYVGFCAGAFLTTSKVGQTSVTGLGIVPGRSKLYRKSPTGVSVQTLTTPQGLTYQYWEGGSYFSFSTSQLANITVLTRYQRTNQINGIQTTFGEGRVAVTGTHPEAPQWWYDDAHITDADGLDNMEAARMIKWAAKISP